MKIPYKYIFNLFLLTAFSFSSANAISLWMKSKNNERGMFANKTASQFGDILTIILSESTTMKNETKTTTDKVAGIENTVTQFL